MIPVEKPTQADRARETLATIFDDEGMPATAAMLRAGGDMRFSSARFPLMAIERALAADQAARTTTTTADVDRPDGNELWEALFGILKGGVPEELTEEVCQQLVEALAFPFTTTIEGVRTALEPVMHWYQSDEHEPRPLHEIVADVVADLEEDRATVLQAARTTTTEGVRGALKEAHDILHETTAVLGANDCAKVAAVMKRLRAILATPPATPAGGGWIVANGAGNRWRCWSDFGSDWTDDREKATRYHRREDAEAVHAGDEDAWSVTPYRAALSPSPDAAPAREAGHG